MNLLTEYIRWLAPEWILLLGACVVLFAGLSRAAAQRGVVQGLALLVVIAAWVVALRQGIPESDAVLPGLWFTSLTWYVRCLGLGIGALIILINWHQPLASERGEYMAMILFSLLGVMLTASANDLVVLFFAVELVSVPTYVLIALSREDTRASEATVKYFFLGAFSAAILAYGLSFLYGASGTTALYTFTEGVARSTLPFGSDISSTALIGLVLVFAGLSFKVAAVPLHFYVADVYEGAASPVAGLLGFVPKFAGFVALAKVFVACHWSLPPAVWWMIWVVAAATMTVGNVLALLQKNVKRMLGYSSVAHTGYMLIALLVGPVWGMGPLSDGLAAMLFYVAVYGAMNLGAFAVLSAHRSGERDLEMLDELGGLSTRRPWAALGLAVCAFSLMGLPPTAGFMGKFYVFGSAFSLDARHPFSGPLIALAILGVINAAIAAAYYLRIISAAYVAPEVAEPRPVGGRPVRLGIVLCALPMLILFVWPAALNHPARRATIVPQRTARAPAGQLAAAHEHVPMPTDAPLAIPSAYEPAETQPRR